MSRWVAIPLLLSIAACSGLTGNARELASAGTALERCSALPAPPRESGVCEAAIEAYRALLDREPRNPRALHGLALSHVASGDAEVALPIFAGLEALAPAYFKSTARDSYHAALERVASERSAEGDPEGALRLLERIAEGDPKREGLRDRMSELRSSDSPASISP